MQKWKIGDVTITKVVESEIPGKATWIVPDATPERLREIERCKPHFVREDGSAVMSVHALLVESQGQKIVVDTCVGNDKTLPGMKAWNKRTGGTFIQDISDQGFAPDAVDTVLCTHLHVDHVGWNTLWVDGKWMPTFGKARYLWNRAEYDHWKDQGPDSFGDVVTESVRPVFDAGLVDLVEEDQKITDEVRLEPTPGHTPGHVSIKIESGGEQAVITGDLTHHPAQITHPEWHSSADWDREMGEKTRRSFIERYGDQPVLVIGTHFATPTAGHIVKDGDSYRLDL